MVKRGRAEDLGIRAREGRLRGSRRGQRLRLRERVAGKMELTSGVTLSAGRSGDKARARATRAVAGLGRMSRAEHDAGRASVGRRALRGRREAGT